MVKVTTNTETGDRGTYIFIFFLILIMCLWLFDRAVVKYLQMCWLRSFVCLLCCLLSLFVCCFLGGLIVCFLFLNYATQLIQAVHGDPQSLFSTISCKNILASITHIKLEEKRGKTSCPWDLLVLCGYCHPYLPEWFILSLYKKGEWYFASDYFFSNPKELFYDDISSKLSNERNPIFNSWHDEVCVQATVLDFGPAWAN